MDPGRIGGPFRADRKRPQRTDEDWDDDGSGDEDVRLIKRRPLNPFGVSPPPVRKKSLKLSGRSGGAAAGVPAVPLELWDGDQAASSPGPALACAPASGRRWTRGLALQSRGPVAAGDGASASSASSKDLRCAGQASRRESGCSRLPQKRLWPAGAVQVPPAEDEVGATPSSSSSASLTRRKSAGPPPPAPASAPVGSERRRASAPGALRAPHAARMTQAHCPSLSELFRFLQCQLRLEASELLGRDVQLTDPLAADMWDVYEAFARPNLGANERWVPYHTCLGVHERFLIEKVHNSKEAVWDDKRRFLCMFIFRAHCKCELFTSVQLPMLLSESFWRDPVGAFADNGEMEQSMLHYRRSTGKPMLTLAFLMIPKRVLQDDDANLVRSIVVRTRRLLEVAARIFPVVLSEKSAERKFEEISRMILGTNGLGETWAKMLMVCIDLAYPEIGLLQSQCDVGRGAVAPLRVLLNLPEVPDKKAALKQLTRNFNASSSSSSQHFWQLLALVEAYARDTFRDAPLILQQVCTRGNDLTAVTLQVQLCEYRQFRKVRARLDGCDGDDWLQLLDSDNRSRPQRPEDMLTYEQKARRVEFRTGELPEPFVVQLADTRGRRRYAERVALMCLLELRSGSPLAKVCELRERLCCECGEAGQQDVPDDSEAWEKCRSNANRSVVACSLRNPSGTRMVFQTTVGASGGSIMEAERIARLCYLEAAQGASKEAVLAIRDCLHKGGNTSSMPW